LVKRQRYLLSRLFCQKRLERFPPLRQRPPWRSSRLLLLAKHQRFLLCLFCQKRLEQFLSLR
jgi:hypothetical protein